MASCGLQYPFGQSTTALHDPFMASKDMRMLDINDTFENAAARLCRPESQNLLRVSHIQDGYHMRQHQGLPPITQFSNQKVPTREDWEYHRPVIKKLYWEQKRSLKEVVELMAKHYGFKANERMYKKRISDWDIRRNLRWSEREEISKVIIQKHLLQDSKAMIVVNGQEKQVALFTRHMRQARRRSQAIQHQQLANIRDNAVSQAGLKHSRKQMRRIFGSQHCVRDIMYPPGDSRLIEVMCTQVSHLSELVSDHVLKSLVDESIYQTLLLAMNNATACRYREARILINKAADMFQEQATAQPYAALLGLIYCLHLRSLRQLDHFNALKLFHDHALELSAEVYCPQHPATMMLSLFFKLEDWNDATQCAFRCGLMSIKPTATTPAFLGAKFWLRGRLAFAYEYSGDFCKAERLLLDDFEEMKDDRYDVFERAFALYELGYYYANSRPSKYADAEALFREIHDAGTRAEDPDYHHYCNWLTYDGLARLSRYQGDLSRALEYQRLCLAAAISCWGDEDTAVFQAAEDLAYLLEEEGKMDEAEQARNMVKIMMIRTSMD